jgi:hypothetical protein
MLLSYSDLGRRGRGSACGDKVEDSDGAFFIGKVFFETGPGSSLTSIRR